MKPGPGRNRDAGDALRQKIAAVPDRPGIYIFRDAGSRVLYVGKAKGLRTRISSYFRKSSGLDARKLTMVRAIRDFEFTVTQNELEALVLEANLIKQFRPRYNVLLRDDKNYPYLRLTVQDEWPRLEVTRRVRKDGARYYGPFIPAGGMWSLLSFIRNTFRLPSCKQSFDQRIRPCIQHQIGRCDAPCAGMVERGEYLAMIAQVRMLLEGKNSGLLSELHRRMQEASNALRYEEAALLRDRIRAIEAAGETQHIVDPALGDIDVVAMARGDEKLAFRVLHVRNGAMVGAQDFLLRDIEGEADPFCMKGFLEQFFRREVIVPAEILCGVMPEDEGLLAEWLSGKRGARVTLHVPQRGAKKELVDMARENAAIGLGRLAPDDLQMVLADISLRLHLAEAPLSIGAFDISNIGADSAVGAFVFWEQGEFRKERYRHIRMQDVKGPDDYGMMREMIGRTVKSIGQEMPDLIIIDGGKEHLDAALSVFREQDIRAERVVSLAKDPDRVFLPEDGGPVLLDDRTPADLLLRRIRDEVHRFALRYHRALRGRRAFETPLDAIYGIGRRRRFALLEHFGTIDAIRRAGVEEIASVRGFTRSLAEKVVAALHEKPPKERE